MTADIKVAILGAGFAGLCMGLKLQARGETDFLILEKADRVGGTWRENTYPGCGCDIPSHLYSFSFALNPDWPRVYSAQPDILAYIEGVVAQNGLDAQIRLNTEVTSAVWDAATNLWRITAADGFAITAETLVTAWGQLNRPKIPQIPGHDAFAGAAFHSARWDHGVELAGKRVAVIGNGASAIQFVPEIAKVAGQLTLFQRSPNWIVPRLDRPYTAEEMAAFRANPALMQAVRDEIFRMAEDRLAARRAGTLPVEEVPIPLAHLRAQITDPELLAKLTPDYELGCKRVLISNDFYPALTRPNVTLVTDGVARLSPEGVVDGAGRLHEADVVIYATGFETRSFAGDLKIRGLDGLDLNTAWADGPEAYLGITTPGFPNLFMLYGPNTNLGHNSIIYMLEAQADYVLQALEAAAAAGPIVVRPEVSRAYNDELQAALAHTPWAGSCTSWYKTEGGKILNNWPHTAQAYAEAVARFDAGAYASAVRASEPAE
ncbi:flavin-containing monooxygenase [Phenylobacterium aquaticum]|uniref:flavin-containing monooxygenase n=1 Tax=Phenylobacterium aquaticum TaxID=1763816 RepID=UPI001F5C98E3|nr:NAD(P)/FAD-dependent oxidoreductase [Phenylobacterium aquaticum]MCI3133795.1 NAD(P)/FAD-dependent oxidoreductase [Phenylobacterium aquaticum]